MASQEQSLAQMIQFGKSQSMQAGVIAMIEELRLDAENLEAQTRINQSAYDDLVQEIKARLEQRIKEVKDKVQIQPFADLQAANLATDQKVKALEQKAVIFEKENDDAKLANEQLSSKIEALAAQNLQLESQGQQLQQKFEKSEE